MAAKTIENISVVNDDSDRKLRINKHEFSALQRELGKQDLE